ncbi:MAG: signal peptidase I [Clostridia bacterium]
MEEMNIEETKNEFKTRAFQDELFDWAQNIAIILSVVVLVFIFVVRVIGVEGDSMRETLHNGDWMLISNLFYEPSYGDIVVLKKNEFMEQPIVKRIIATEGQTVDIDFTTGVVSVDGKPLKESYTAEPTYRQFDTNFPATVPKGCVFVMGDNRNHSSDSRVSSLGMVDERYILGRLLFRILPLNAFGTVKQDYETVG